MTRFERMGDYPDVIKERFNSFIVTQFDDSLSVEMQIRSLIKWISSSRDLINDVVDYINLFIEMYDERLQEEIVGRLNEWLDNGTLANIINNNVFDMKADKLFVNSEIERLDQKDENIIIQLAHKSDKTALEIERLRINNLVANAGDTDGNAELLDIRVGIDGVVYDSAGEAVRNVLAPYMAEERGEW